MGGREGGWEGRKHGGEGGEGGKEGRGGGAGPVNPPSNTFFTFSIFFLILAVSTIFPFRASIPIAKKILAHVV